MRRYQMLFAETEIRRLILGAALVRYPLTMMPLALLLLVYHNYDSFTKAGLVAGLHACASAMAVAGQRQLASRYGPRIVLLSTGAANVAAIVLLLAMVQARLPILIIAVAAALAGAVLPIVGPVIQPILTAHAHEDLSKRSDPLLTEVVSITGPLFVAILASTASISFVLLITAVAAGVGAGMVALDERISPVVPPQNSPNPSVRLVTTVFIFCSIAGVLFGFGALDVALASFVDGRPVTGLLLALWAVGGVLGSLWWGKLTRPIQLITAYRWALLILAVGHLPLLLAAKTITVAILLIPAGLSITPAMAIGSALLKEASTSAPWLRLWASGVGYFFLTIGAITAGIMSDREVDKNLVFVLSAGAPLVGLLMASIGQWITTMAVTPVGRHRAPTS